MSIEAVRRWKPAPEPYWHATEVCKVSRERMALVAAHGWDMHGAHNAGLVTGWVNRSHAQWSDLFDPPDLTGPDLLSVVHSLVALGSS